MRLRPPRRQSRRQRPRIEVCDRDVVDEAPNRADRGVGVDDVEKAALPQLFAIAEMLGKRLKPSRRQPFRVIVGLIDDVLGGLGESFLGIVGYDQKPGAAGEANVIGGPVLLLQLDDIAVVDVPVSPRHREAIAKTRGAAQCRRREAAQPDRRMRLLDRLRCHLDVVEVEELALEGNRLSGKRAPNYFKGLVGSRAALFERHTETFELFPFEADPGAELETTAGDHINGRNVLGKAYGIVKRYQEHAGYDADPVGAGGDRRGYGQDRGQIPVLDEVVLRQPHIVKPVVLSPRDLIEDFAVEPVGGLPPLWWISEVVPKTKAELSTVVTHDSPLLIDQRRLIGRRGKHSLRSEPRRRPRRA